MRVQVTRLGHLGDGLGDGVFVPRALPGEMVEGTVEAGRMAAPKIVTPAPERVAPPCPHYRACGGCALQHASDAFVTAWKQDVLRAALAAQGLDAPFLVPHVSPPGARRRATLAGRRRKKGVLVGFHGRASEVLSEVPECKVLAPGILAMLPVLEELVRLGASRKAELALAVTLADAGADVSVRGGKPLDGPLRAALGQLAGQVGLARLAWEGEVVAQAAPPAQRFGRALVVPPPGAFLQATAEGEAALLAAVRQAVAGARQVADLFAGCGTFALPLAEAAEVHAVEGAAEMLAALDAGWRQATGLRRVTTEARDLFRNPLTPEELARFDAVVIDPPRAGAEAQVAMLAQAEVPVIAAVSCNPVSFARDARMLVQAGYILEWAQVVDQFRWSPHVELAARLTKGHMAQG